MPRDNVTTWEPRHTTAAYPYTDERGDLVFEVLRIEEPGQKKTFRQRRPDGNGGWIWNLDGVTPVPYRLRDILDRPEDAPIFVCEGEKDADRLAALGLAATTSHGGSSAWPEALNQYFLGADVVILPDNDEPGRKHAAQVAAALAHTAASVRVVDLPGLGPKGDASDWLDAGGTAEDLFQLAERAAVVEGPRDPLDPDDLGALLAEDIEPREWLLGTTLCRRNLTVLAAAGGSGKTSLAIAWALSLATGRNLAAMHVHKPCRVLVLTFEDGREEYKRRFKAACLHHGIAPAEVSGRVWVKSVAGLEGAYTLAEAGERGAMRETGLAERIGLIARRYEIDVVVLDPFVKASGAPENDNGATDFVARVLTRLAEQENVAVLVAHHFRKGLATPGDIAASRGASSLIDAARIACTLLPMSTDEAQKFGIPEPERRQLVRLDDGKANLAPLRAARWYRLASVNLGNGTPEYPNGDNVQAVEPWSPPDAWDGLSTDTLNRILDDIDAGTPDGERYSDAPAAKGNAAWRVVQTHSPDKTEKQCREVIAAWLASALLRVEQYRSPNRRADRFGLVVDPSKRPGLEWR